MTPKRVKAARGSEDTNTSACHSSLKQTPDRKLSDRDAEDSAGFYLVGSREIILGPKIYSQEFDFQETRQSLICLCGGTMSAPKTPG